MRVLSLLLYFLFPDQTPGGSGKSRKGSGRPGDAAAASGRSQPLNLSQVTTPQQTMTSSAQDQTGSGSLRRQHAFPPPVSSYNGLFGSPPSLYAYPASAALASVSQAVDQMQGGPPRHARVGGAYPSLALLQKNLGGSGPAQQGAPPFQQLHRKLNQYPYL